MLNFDFLHPGRQSTLEMIHFLLLHKLARMPLKKRFRIAIIVPGKCNNILMLPHFMQIYVISFALLQLSFPRLHKISVNDGGKIARRKLFFRDTLANLCKIKNCIISNVDYRPGSKKSKFDMTLISKVLLGVSHLHIFSKLIDRNLIF